MRISDLTNTTRLYRGDASYVQHFEVGKTDAHALFGHGIYLTDSAEVAADYTMKTSGDIVFPTNNREEPYTSSQALVRAYLGKIAEDLGFKQAHETMRAEWQAKASARQQELYAQTGSHPSYSDARASIADIEEAYGVERRKLAQKFVAQAKRVYAGMDLRMVQKTTGEWVMVKPDRQGIVSTFDVPNEYCAKALDAEAPVPDALLPIIKAAFYAGHKAPLDGPLDLRGWDEQGKELMGLPFDKYIEVYKTRGSRYAWAGHLIGGKGLNPTIDEMLNGTHSGYYVWKESQNEMIRRFQALGYTGFKYQGGVRVAGQANRGGGGILHNAYSFWDEKTVNGFRTDHHQRAPDQKAASAKGIRAKGIL